MKFFTLIGLILLVPLNSIQSQDKKEVIQLERNEELIQSVDLGDQGIILHTGKNYMNSKKLNWQLRYYAPNLDLIWKVPVEKQQISKGFDNPLVTSPHGEFTYLLEYMGYNKFIGASKIQLHQINKEGKLASHEFEIPKEFGEKLVTFANNRYLYILTSEKDFYYMDSGKDFQKGKTKQKLYFNRIRHNDFSNERIELSLPPVDDSENTTYWSFAGHNNEYIWFISKDIDFKQKKYSYSVLFLDNDGKIVKKVGVECNLSESYIRPSYNFKDFNTSYKARDNDFFSSSRTGHIYPRRGAFSNIRIDGSGNAIYIYGLTGAKPFTNFAAVYSGYFIYKYDLDGNMLWKTEKVLPSEITKESYFHVNAAPENRNLIFQIQPDKLALKIYFKDQSYSMEFSNDGTPVESYGCKFKNEKYISYQDAMMCFSDASTLKSYKYLTSMDPKEKKKLLFKYFNHSLDEILLEMHPKENLINLLYFKK